MIAQNISIGLSPCPNDTFIFYAMMHNRIKNDRYRFNQLFEDVETLNLMAMRSTLDVTKISYHALGHVRDGYCILRSGGALGRGCGPLVVAREAGAIGDLVGKKIAAPGRYTTAFLLLELYDPAFRDNVVFMPFHEIMESVQNGDVDAGLIIHESRFTYGLYGLSQIIDLGQWWERETGFPIPLGAIGAQRRLGVDTVRQIEGLIRASIDYAFSHRDETMPYIKKHSQEMSDDVIEKHISLYVNDFSRDVGEEGERAIHKLMSMAEERGIFGSYREPLFIS